MTRFSAEFCAYVLQLYVVATVLLVGGCIAMLATRQAVQRILIARGTLAALLVSALIPLWPAAWQLPFASAQLNWIVISVPTATNLQTPGIQATPAASPIAIAEQTPGSRQLTQKTSTPPPATTQRLVTPNASVLPTTPEARPHRWSRSLCWLLLGGYTLLLGRLLLGRLLLARILYASQPAASNIEFQLRQLSKKKRISVRTSSLIHEPVAFGLLRPVILLPHELGEEQDSVAAILHHECEHIRRGDLWTLAACRWLHVLLLAHPLLWYLRRQLSSAQEFVVDAQVAQVISPTRYAASLVQWARNRQQKRTLLAHQLLLLLGGQSLRNRITRILTREPERLSSSSTSVIFTVGTFTVLTAILSSTSVTSVRTITPLRSANILHSGQLPTPELRPDMAAPKVRRFVVALDDEVSLEVLGLRSHPCDGQCWWDLDGNLVAGAAPPCGTAAFPPELIVQVKTQHTNPAWTPDLHSALPLDPRELGWASPPPTEGNSYFAIRLASWSAAIDIHMIHTEWKTRSLSTCAKFFDNQDFQYFPCSESENLVVSVAHKRSDNEQLKLMAVDTAGIEHRPVEQTNRPHELTAIFGNLELEETQYFYVQSRPQLKIHLEDLPLTPRATANSSSKIANLEPTHSSHQSMQL